LLLATAAVDLAAIQLHGDLPWPSWFGIIAFANAFAQTSIFAIWLGIGRGPLIVRLAALIAVIAFWSCVLSTVWTFGLASLSASVVLGVLLLRALGYVLSIVDPAGPSAAGDSRFQFSLWDVFLWMTAAAGVAYGARYFDNIGYAPWFATALITLPFSITAVWALWSVLSLGNPAGRIVLLVGIAFLLGAVGHYWRIADAAMSQKVVHCAANGGMCVLHALVIAAVLFVFRMAGYRLVRNQSSSAVRPSSAT
jgi:hypothetical protein